MQEAKARVYTVTQAPPDAPEGGKRTPQPRLTPVLEQMPKWEMLQQVAEEVQTQRALLASKAGSSAPAATKHRACDADSDQAQASEHDESGMPAKRKRQRAVSEVGASHGGDSTSNRARSAQLSSAQLQAGPVAADALPVRSNLEALSPQGGSPKKHLHPTSGVPDEVIDLLDSQSPVRKHAAHRAAAAAMPPQQSPTGDPLKHPADLANEAASADDPHAWIDTLPSAEALSCADAAVLLIAKERHMLTELRSILAVRASPSACDGQFYKAQHGRCVALMFSSSVATIAHT